MIKNGLLAILAVMLTGCLVAIDSDSRTLQTTWSEGDVSRLELGRSDEQFVRGTFGEPISRRTHADGTEVWKYRNRSEKDTQVGVFLLFSVDVEQERTETLAIEFVDGVVSNYWIDEERF